MRKRPEGSGRKRSWTDQQLTAAVSGSKSIRAVFLHLGLRVGGGAHVSMQRHIERLGLDTSHFTGQAWNKGLRGLRGKRRIPLDVILVKNSTYLGTANLKARLFAEELLRNECYQCGAPPEWRGQPLVLRLDHINGDRADQRIENLRILCPNCDAQMPTFAGRNKRRK